DEGAVAVPDLDAFVVQPVGGAPDAGTGGTELQVERGPLRSDARPAHPRDVRPRDPACEVDEVRTEVEQGVVGHGVRAPPAPAGGDLPRYRHLASAREGR